MGSRRGGRSRANDRGGAGRGLWERRSCRDQLRQSRQECRSYNQVRPGLFPGAVSRRGGRSRANDRAGAPTRSVGARSCRDQLRQSRQECRSYNQVRPGLFPGMVSRRGGRSRANDRGGAGRGLWERHSCRDHLRQSRQECRSYYNMRPGLCFPGYAMACSVHLSSGSSFLRSKPSTILP